MWQYCSVWDDMIEFALTRLSELSYDGVPDHIRSFTSVLKPVCSTNLFLHSLRWLFQDCHLGNWTRTGLLISSNCVLVSFLWIFTLWLPNANVGLKLYTKTWLDPTGRAYNAPHIL